MFWYFSTYNSLRNDCHFKNCKFAVFSTGSFCQVYRVTDEALIAETAVWPNFYLMNIFFALKGSKLFIIIWSFLQLDRPVYYHRLLNLINTTL